MAIRTTRKEMMQHRHQLQVNLPKSMKHRPPVEVISRNELILLNRNPDRVLPVVRVKIILIVRK